MCKRKLAGLDHLLEPAEVALLALADRAADERHHQRHHQGLRLEAGTEEHAGSIALVDELELDGEARRDLTILALLLTLVALLAMMIPARAGRSRIPR